MTNRRRATPTGSVRVEVRASRLGRDQDLAGAGSERLLDVLDAAPLGGSEKRRQGGQVVSLPERLAVRAAEHRGEGGSVVFDSLQYLTAIANYRWRLWDGRTRAALRLSNISTSYPARRGVADSDIRSRLCVVRAAIGPPARRWWAPSQWPEGSPRSTSPPTVACPTGASGPMASARRASA